MMMCIFMDDDDDDDDPAWRYDDVYDEVSCGHVASDGCLVNVEGRNPPDLIYNFEWER